MRAAEYVDKTPNIGFQQLKLSPTRLLMEERTLKDGTATIAEPERRSARKLRTLAPSSPSRTMARPAKMPSFPGGGYGAAIKNGRQGRRGENSQVKPSKGPEDHQDQAPHGANGQPS
jgi:hypothetical protein